MSDCLGKGKNPSLAQARKVVGGCNLGEKQCGI